MSKIPSLTGRQLISKLRKLGFVVSRIKGSHHFLRHFDGRTTVVPVHGKEVIGTGLFHKILKDCEITVTQLLD
jgi:predicted RNA binding protein YcfA (HicA-like mRNA interferase family)